MGTVGFHKEGYEKTSKTWLSREVWLSQTSQREKESRRKLEAARRLISSSQEELLISNEKRSVYC